MIKYFIEGKERKIYFHKDNIAFYKSKGNQVDVTYMFKKTGSKLVLRKKYINGGIPPTVRKFTPNTVLRLFGQKNRAQIVQEEELAEKQAEEKRLANAIQETERKEEQKQKVQDAIKLYQIATDVLISDINHLDGANNFYSYLENQAKFYNFVSIIKTYTVMYELPELSSNTLSENQELIFNSLELLRNDPNRKGFITQYFKTDWTPSDIEQDSQFASRFIYVINKLNEKLNPKLKVDTLEEISGNLKNYNETHLYKILGVFLINNEILIKPPESNIVVYGRELETVLNPIIEDLFKQYNVKVEPVLKKLSLESIDDSYDNILQIILTFIDENDALFDATFKELAYKHLTRLKLSKSYFDSNANEFNQAKEVLKKRITAETSKLFNNLQKLPDNTELLSIEIFKYFNLNNDDFSFFKDLIEDIIKEEINGGKSNIKMFIDGKNRKIIFRKDNTAYYNSDKKQIDITHMFKKIEGILKIKKKYGGTNPNYSQRDYLNGTALGNPDSAYGTALGNLECFIEILKLLQWYYYKTKLLNSLEEIKDKLTEQDYLKQQTKLTNKEDKYFNNSNQSQLGGKKKPKKKLIKAL